MPDLQSQLRDYARFAVAVVEPVRPDEVVDRPAVAGRRRVPARALAGIVALAAVIGAVVFWPRDEERTVRVAAEPPPTVATTTTTQPAPPLPSPSFAALARSAGIAGVRRGGAGEAAVKIVTLDGTAVWVVLPDDTPGLADLQVVPMAVVGLRGGTAGPAVFLSSLADTEVAAGQCREVPNGFCREPVVAARRVLGDGGVFTRWGLSIAEPLTTVRMGEWTLVMEGGDASMNERIAAALVWDVDGEGYLRLRSADPEVDVWPSPVQLAANVSGEPADGLRILVLEGCGTGGPGGRATGELARFTIGPPRLAPSQPPAYLGRWCAGGTHRVEVTTGDAALVDLLYERLRIEPAR